MTTKVFRLLPDGEPATGMQPSNFTDQNAFTTADKREVNHTFFQTEDGSTLSGVWECAPCREEIDAYPAHEMMTVLAGSVTLTNADGSFDTLQRVIPSSSPREPNVFGKLLKPYASTT